MLKSFLKITYRLLWRNKINSLIKISSLAFGMAAFILIMIYVHHEYSIDRFNENYDRIYRIEADDYGKLAPIMAEHLINEIPEIESLARITGFGHNIEFTYQDPSRIESSRSISAHFFYADSSLFDIFTFPMLRGEPDDALSRPFTAVISESLSNKLFGSEDPVGKVISTVGDQWTITGVMKDIENAHFESDAFFSHVSIEKKFPDRNINQKPSDYFLWDVTYILLPAATNISLLEKKINRVLEPINNIEMIGYEFDGFSLRALKDIYQNGAIAHEGEYAYHGNPVIVHSFIAIAIFILLMAIINYVNLTTARSSLRTKEVAIKKVMGSAFWRLRMQFIFESMILTIISYILALTLIQALASPFKNLVQINFNPSELNNLQFWSLSLAGILGIGFIAGLYPAFFLTSMNSVSLMKGEQKTGRGATVIRRILLTSQFVVSVILIIAILTNLRQLHFVRSMDMGFNKEQVISTTTGDSDESVKQTLKNRLLAIPGVSNVSFSSGGIGNQDPGVSPTFEINGVKKSLNFITIDPDYADVMGLEILEGRMPEKGRKGDIFNTGETVRFVINETGLKYLGMDSIGILPVPTHFENRSERWEIIGVVKDFHYQSLHHQIEPMILFWLEPVGHLANIKLSGHDIPKTIQAIEQVWKETLGWDKFDFEFLDQIYAEKYQKEERAARVIGYFTVLAVLISSMGLFALSSFMVSRKTKEIGIRKALGATVASIFINLSKEYLKWIALSLIIATPIGWYLMYKWLEKFAYKIDLGLDMFLLTAVLTLLIALITVSWQSFKTARANPIRALRYE